MTDTQNGSQGALSATETAARAFLNGEVPRSAGGLVLGGAQPSTPPAAAPASSHASRFMDGGSFIHDAPANVPALWGAGGDVLWSEGEPLILAGPSGVGKTTLAGQILAGRLGLIKTVLGYPVQPGKRVLYLAMDRPSQIRRAHARLLRRFPREILADRLVVWNGPPPRDLARDPAALLEMAHDARADSVFIDSLKDAAVKLSDEETGQGINNAMQLCVSNDIQTLALHHQRKAAQGGSAPTSLSDVYGSAWITAGAGSVVLLWGAAGDPIVDLRHLKTPANEVGPLRVEHDHTRGISGVWRGAGVLDLLADGPKSVRDVARALYGDKPSDSDVEKARRKLDASVRDGSAVKVSEPSEGGSQAGRRGGGTGARYVVAGAAQ